MCNVKQWNTEQCNTVKCMYNAIQCNAKNAKQCNTVKYTALPCKTIETCDTQQKMECNASLCITIQCNTYKCNAMHFNAVSKMQNNAMQWKTIEKCNTKQNNAMQCITMNCNRM